MMGQGLAFAPNFNAAKISAGRIFQLLDRIPKMTSLPEMPEEKDWVSYVYYFIYLLVGFTLY